jgi:hypothetical protein
MRFRHAAILAGRLDGCGGVDILAERLHRYAWRRSDMLVGRLRWRSVFRHYLIGLFHRRPDLLTSTR